MPIDITQPVELIDGTPLSNIRTWGSGLFSADLPEGYSAAYDGGCDSERLFHISDGCHSYNSLPSARNVTGERPAIPERGPERLSFDPMQPIELDDGTPCQIARCQHWAGNGMLWQAHILERDTQERFFAGQLCWFTGEGRYRGEPDYAAILNVDPDVPDHVRKARREYAKLPSDLKPDFLSEDWFKPHADLHFPRLVERDEVAMVAFYENDRKLEAGRLTEMRVGRYVRRFNGGKLKDEDVERIAAASDVKLRGNRVKITQDADEIEQVYVNGPNSCMAHPARCFDTGGIHPARVYAGPDLALAYIGEPDDPSSRCVVWPEKKIHSTIYGDCNRMRQMLAQMGYTEGGLDGARVRYIECDSGTVMPYVDGIYSASHVGDYVVLGRRGDIDCSSTDGLGEDTERVYCEHCDERVDYDETAPVHSNRYDYETWCDSCSSADATYCEFAHEYVRDDCMVTVITASGATDSCAEWELERNDFVLVNAGAHDGEWVHSDLTADHGCYTYHVDDAPEDGADDELPRVSVAEAEAAGQMALPIEAPVAVRQDRACRLVNLPRSGHQTPHQCTLETGDNVGTFEECWSQLLRLRDRCGHGRNFHYWIEAVDAGPLGYASPSLDLAIAA